MTAIGFIGLGNMGGPMVRNLMSAGHTVTGFDIVAAACERARADGVSIAATVAATAAGADVVITMLPAGAQVRKVYLGDGGLLDAVTPGRLLIDSSTIDIAAARAVHAGATDRGFDMIDAPVSGGVAGAEAASLTFMVGGSERAFERAKPILEAMGKNIFHAGAAGNGQAAKTCNNMILGISMIAVSEAFALGDRVGLDRQKLFDIVAAASGQCWSLTTYCPVPGPVPTSPANRGYQAGFTADMMLKDLNLAQDAARTSGATTELGAAAAALYTRYCEAGDGGSDFSGIIRMIADESSPPTP